MHVNISVHTPLLPLALICMHTHADLTLYETLPFCNCTSSDKKIVTKGEEARNLSSIQSKWGVNGSFFIREQLSKHGPVGERVGREAQWQLNTVKGGNTVLQWWWYQMARLWCFDICSGSESLPYSYHDIYSMIQKSKNLFFKHENKWRIRILKM